MTPEQQQDAIAEACGWRKTTARHPSSGNIVTVWTDGKSAWGSRRLPDYLSDLNAMHEAEKILNKDQKRHYACAKLRGGVFDAVHSTAAQRAEAFLKTLSLWKP